MVQKPAATHSIRGALALIAVFALILSAGPLFLTPLESGDETRVAGIAAEMEFEHEWFLPRLNGKPFLEYPPLAYQLMAVSYKIFGVNTAAARLPSVLFGAGGLFLAFLFALRLGLPVSGALFTAAVLGTGAQYCGTFGKCTVDMQLAFFINLAVCGFYCFTTAPSRRARGAYLLLAALGFLGGIFTKGLLGAALPGAVLGAWLVYRDLRRQTFSWTDYLALALCGTAALAGAAFWYIHIHRECGEASGFEAVVIQNFGRFSGHQGDHVVPFWYYLEKLPMLFQPYLLLLLPGLWYILRRRHGREECGLMLPVIFVLLSFVLLSCAASKRVCYLLMLALPCALTTAIFVRTIAERFGGRVPAVLRSARCQAALLLAAGALCTGGNLIYNELKESEDVSGLFAECRSLEAQGIRILLATDAERTRGAACFYLGHTVPVIDRQAPHPQPGAAHLYRTRKKPFPDAAAFPDKHYLVSGGPAGSPGTRPNPIKERQHE